MTLHDNRDEFSLLVAAASKPQEEGGLGIQPLFIEKDYWICRSLQMLSCIFLALKGTICNFL